MIKYCLFTSTTLMSALVLFGCSAPHRDRLSPDKGIKESAQIEQPTLTESSPEPGSEAPLPETPIDEVVVTVSIPTFENTTCPIMGKRVSKPLYAETSYGRIYVCCKPCIQPIIDDLATTYKAAYPVAEILENTTCPISGRPIVETGVLVELQRFQFKVCCEECVQEAQRESQTTLVKLTQSDVVDIGNERCPITQDPVVPNAFVMIDNNLVGLSSPSSIEHVERDPMVALAKAKQITDGQSREAHDHATSDDGIGNSPPK